MVIAYVSSYSDSAINGTLRLEFLRNDSNEPNNGMESATPISDGDSVDFVLDSYDDDWFVVETTRAGEFISVTSTADSNSYG